MNKKVKTANIVIDRKQFFFKWVEFTRPFHGLRKQLQHLLALLLYHHYTLGLVIKHEGILWKQVFDYDTKVLIMSEMEIQQSTLENLLYTLRKSKIIKNNRIEPAYVPNITAESTNFIININFKFNDDSGRKEDS